MSWNQPFGVHSETRGVLQPESWDAKRSVVPRRGGCHGSRGKTVENREKMECNSTRGDAHFHSLTRLPSCCNVVFVRSFSLAPAPHQRRSSEESKTDAR